jgi:hypothetical protein
METQARDHLSKFMDIWKDADTDLKEMEEARQMGLSS